MRRSLRNSMHAARHAAITVAVVTACSGSRADQPPADSAGGDTPPPVAAAPPVTAPPQAPAQGAVPQVDPDDVNASIVWDPATKSAEIPVVSSLTSAAGGWNFNGFANGDATLVVPVGTTVRMDYYNADAAPHSVGMVKGDPAAIPSAPGDPAIPNAVSRRFVTGLGPNQRDLVTFIANEPGRYLMVCGVPGHAVGGMWMHFEVSTSATQPTYRTK